MVVVSNRLPISAQRDRKTGVWTFKMSSGGLVTALQGVRHEMDFLWIGWMGVEVEEAERVSWILSTNGMGTVGGWVLWGRGGGGGRARTHGAGGGGEISFFLGGCGKKTTHREERRSNALSWISPCRDLAAFGFCIV